jgi:hypothetical protein
LPFADPQKKRDYNRTYARKRRAEPEYREKEQLRRRLWYAKNKDKMREYYNRRTKATMSKLREKLGNECVVGKILNMKCWVVNKDGSSRLDIHNKKGENHSTNSNYYHAHILNDQEKINDWVLLCRRHHKIVEFCLQQLGMTWEEFVSRLQANLQN